MGKLVIMVKNIKLSIFTTFIFVFFLVTGCNKEISKEERAEEFLKQVLTAPNEKIDEIVDSKPNTEDSNSYERKILEVMNGILGDFVSEDTKEKSNSKIYQEVLMFQGTVANFDQEYTVDNIKLTAHGDDNFTYEATMKTNYTDELVIITGNVQFDDNNYINYMTIIADFPQ